MSHEPPDLAAFTRTLAEAVPHPGRLDRDALLFAAGRAAGRRGRFWPATAAALAVLSASLGATLLFRTPAVVEVVRIVHVPIPAPAPEPAVLPAEEPSPPPAAPLAAEWVTDLRLRERMLREGSSAVPSSPWAAAPSRPTPDVPDLSSLRLNPTHPTGDRFQ